ncbi:MAG: hypothetical protein V4594_08310 [Bacteroidota bacterium]
MKNQIIITALLLLTAFSSCKKDAKEPEVSLAAGATVTAGLYGFDGGTSGKFSSTKAGITQVTAAGITTFSISAIKDGSNESFTLIILKKITTTGKISFGSALSNGGMIISKDYTKPADQALNYSSDRNSRLMQGGGEINVTKLDGNEIEGTFTAICFNNAEKEAFAEQGTFKGTIK